MVCPRHGVSVGSCSHDVDLTPEETNAALDQEEEVCAIDGVDQQVVLDRVEKFAQVSVDEEAPATPCKCVDEDVQNGGEDAAVDSEALKSTNAREDLRPQSGIISKEVFLPPPLPGAPEDASPPTPPPTHPLTPETLIAGRLRPISSERDQREASSSSSPCSVIPTDEEATKSIDRRPPSALSNLSACSETTQLNTVGL